MLHNGTNEFTSCENRLDAKHTFENFLRTSYNFLAYPNKFGCPYPCQQTQYEVKINYFHENSWVDFMEPANFSRTFYLLMSFDSFETLKIEVQYNLRTINVKA